MTQRRFACGYLYHIYRLCPSRIRKDKYGSSDAMARVLGVNREKIYSKIMSKVSEITFA